MNNRKINKQGLKWKGTLKTKIEWTLLVVLVVAIPLAVWSNLFAYEYYYLKCQDRPTEVFGNYYRIPYDKGYGIHPGSDYSNCSWSTPAGKTRDPSTKAGMAQAKKEEPPKANYDLYTPDGYEFTKPSSHSQGYNELETSFKVTTKDSIVFRVREVNKNSDFSYTSLCSKPAEGSWSGTIIGKDGEGRIICRTDPNKYIKDYIVSINIGRTAIMLQAPYGSEGQLKAEAIDVFNAMRPSSN